MNSWSAGASDGIVMVHRSNYRLSLPLLALGTIAALASGPTRQKLLHSVAQRGQSKRLDRGPPAGRAAEKGREGGATSPWQIPWSGWKDIFIRTYSEMNDHRLLAVAAGLVFFVLLAIFPAIGAVVSLYALFADPTSINQHLSMIGSVMPADSFKLLSDEVTRIASKNNGTLGFASIFGLLFALWSANAGTKAIFDGINVAYGEKEKRGFIRLNLTSLAFTIGAIVLLLVAAGAVVVVRLSSPRSAWKTSSRHCSAYSAGRSCSSSLGWRWPYSIATDRTVESQNGVGSPRGALPRASYGSSSRGCSRSTWATSPITTLPTDPWARLSASSSGCGLLSS